MRQNRLTLNDQDYLGLDSCPLELTGNNNKIFIYRRLHITVAALKIYRTGISFSKVKLLILRTLALLCTVVSMWCMREKERKLEKKSSYLEGFPSLSLQGCKRLSLLCCEGNNGEKSAPLCFCKEHT